jgi:hypothetical protein
VGLGLNKILFDGMIIFKILKKMAETKKKKCSRTNNNISIRPF